MLFARRLACCVLFLFAAVGMAFPEERVVINEFMASNATTVRDEDGDFEDWIELYNAGSEAVNLAGWGLSDDPGTPFRWVFPEVELGAGAFLLVFASGKDRRAYGGGMFPPDWLDTLRNATASNAAGVWLFDEEAGVIAEDASGNGNHSVIHGAVRVVDEAVGHALFFSRSNEHSVVVANAPTLQVTNSLTISMWIKPESLGVRQTLLDKAYGGEGAVLLEADGRLTYNWGISGGDEYPYQGFGSMIRVRTNEWSHVVLVRDLEAGNLRWYINGAFVSERLAQYAAAAPSTNALRFGRGRENGYEGGLARPVILPYAADRRLHANFRIGSSGDWLCLTRPDGSTSDLLAAQALPTDISLGRHPDGADEWSYFDRPTPGEGNSTAPSHAVLEQPPVLSHEAGFHEAPFELSMSHPEPGVTILYTLDGSEPMADRLEGQTYVYRNQYAGHSGGEEGPLWSREMRSHVYAGPLSMEDRSSAPYELAAINSEFTAETVEPLSNFVKAVTVRAKAFKEGFVPSRTVTHTFFVHPGALVTNLLPVVSLSLNEDDFFSHEKGLYVYGAHGNYWGRGSLWERSAHLEWFATNGARSLSQEVGVRIHGSGSRSFRLKALRLYARSRRDQENVFHHAFFPGLEARGQPGVPLSTFRRLILRCAGSERSQSYYRDALIQHLVRHLPIDTQAYQPALHFVNGEYWGLINLRERNDDRYIESHYGVTADEVVILSGPGASLNTGHPEDRQPFLEVVAYAGENDLAQAEHYAWIHERVDTDNLALYYAIQVYVNNRDWPDSNIDWWRKRRPDYDASAPYGHDGRWRRMLYDTEFGFGSFSGGPSVNTLNWVMNSSSTANQLFLALFQENTGFRDMFINALADQMNSSFVPGRVHETIDAFEARVQPYRAGHNSRWQLNTSVRSEMYSFATERPAYMRAHVTNMFGLAGVSTLTINNATPDQGIVRVNSLRLDSLLPGLSDPAHPYPWSGVYFAGGGWARGADGSAVAAGGCGGRGICAAFVAVLPGCRDVGGAGGAAAG